MTTDLQELFQSPFDAEHWPQFLREMFGASELYIEPQRIETISGGDIDEGYLLGQTETPDHCRVGFFRYVVPPCAIERRRIGLRNLVKPWLRYNFDAALVAFTSPGTDKWRLSLVCDMKEASTSPKRFTFVFGEPSATYRTAAERFAAIPPSPKFSDIRAAFSVEALSKEFYGELYKWYERAISEESGVYFPNDPEASFDDRENINIKIIRLITRLLFVWFIRQKRLVPDNLFSSDSWVILSPVEQSIKRKIEERGKPLKDWGVNIYRGILTGCNEAFIIDEARRAEILSWCRTASERKRTDALIRPILRGRDIKRYAYDWAHIYLIASHNGYGDVPRIDIERDYPAVKRHLDQFRAAIAKRADKGDTPYNLRNCAYMDDFAKPKIVWGNLSLNAAFAKAPGGMFINAPCVMITPYSDYLLAVLNSKLADWYIRHLGVTRNGGYFEYKPMFVEQLPVPKCGIRVKDDADVYRLYGLTSNEIALVEGQSA